MPGLISQLKPEEPTLIANYREATLGELIKKYEKHKEKPNQPLGRTASFTYTHYPQLLHCAPHL